MTTLVVIALGLGGGTALALEAQPPQVSCEEAAKRWPQVKVGMRETEVLALLGEPKARREAEWDYYWGECLPPPKVGQQLITGLAIFFEEGAVKDVKYAWIDAIGPAPKSVPQKKRKKRSAPAKCG